MCWQSPPGAPVSADGVLQPVLPGPHGAVRSAADPEPRGRARSTRPGPLPRRLPLPAYRQRAQPGRGGPGDRAAGRRQDGRDELGRRRAPAPRAQGGRRGQVQALPHQVHVPPRLEEAADIWGPGKFTVLTVEVGASPSVVLRLRNSATELECGF